MSKRSTPGLAHLGGAAWSGVCEVVVCGLQGDGPVGPLGRSCKLARARRLGIFVRL
jgi:hypothetical protein